MRRREAPSHKAIHIARSRVVYFLTIYVYVVDLSSTEPDWMELYIPYKTSIYILHDDYTI